MDSEFVRAHYKSLSDGEIIRIATEDAYGMTTEAIQIVKDEITKRGLDPNIVKALEIQNKDINKEQLIEFCVKIQTLPCPICGNNSVKLNGTLISKTISYVFLTQQRKNIIIACPNCLDKLNNTALTSSLLFGWWGFPWGIVRTIGSISTNIKSKKTNHLPMPNRALYTFVLSKLGQIEMYKHNNEMLSNILMKQL